jgi:hypothetical protein
VGIDEINIRPIVEGILHEEQRGTLAPGYNVNLAKVAAEGSIGGLALYEDLPYWLDSLLGVATPVDNLDGTYTYSWSAPAGSAPSPRIMTIVYGDGTNDYGGEGMLVDSLTITGESNGPLKFSADLLGEEATTDALASLSDRSVNVPMGDQAALYIDAFGGTIGSTAFSDVAYSFELAINSNRANVHGLGSLKPADYREAKWDGSLRLSLEFSAASKAYLDDIIGASSVLQKLVRIKYSLSTTHYIQLDFAGAALSSPEIFTDEDGVITVDLELTGMYESGLGNWFKAEVMNQVSALP